MIDLDDEDDDDCINEINDTALRIVNPEQEICYSTSTLELYLLRETYERDQLHLFSLL